MKKPSLAGGTIIAGEGVRTGVQVFKLLARLGVGAGKALPAAIRVGGYAASKIALPVYAGVKVFQGGHYLIKNRKRIKSEGFGATIKKDFNVFKILI